nr:zinc finger protein 800-like isoform X2 [Paramormyrops kingsleyae]
MEKPHSALRKTPHLRKQLSRMDWEVGESKLQKTPTKDQCCQTEQHQDDSEAAVPCTDADVGLKAPAFSLEPGDPPLLQQQLQTSKSGIQQIIECFRSGTAQLKHILLREVDTIFECKLCRSLFRGLPNLITHKEFYCFPSILDINDPPSDNKQSKAIKELLEAIYPRKDQPEYVVRLEPIETNQNAVFQFLSREDNQEPEPEAACPPAPEIIAVQPTESPPGEVEELAEPEAQEEPPCEKEESLAQEEVELVPQREENQEEEEEEEEAITGGVDGVRISCCLCGKEFNSRRGVRRHCRKAHESKLEELRKFTETRTLPLSLLSMVKRRPRRAPGAAGRSCPMCQKAFATKANVRRHFDEVHRGLRRDTITPDIATRPGQPLSLDVPNTTTRRHKVAPEFSLSGCRCLLCHRKYSSQVMLKRHMRIVHKIQNGPGPSPGVKVKQEALERNDVEVRVPPGGPPVAPEMEKKPAGIKKKPKKGGEGPKARRTKLAVGFDFRQLYCKLCKRQFTSRQNLTKHIELHTDGTEIYIKFYCCPICSYESRRKRDVIRHITVVHKKSSRYLAKIVPTLETRAVKKPAEMVLNSATRRGPHREDADGRHDPPSVPPAAATFPAGRRQDDQEGGSELKVTKNFVLHTCDVCGRAFAKKLYLESHKRSHRANSGLTPGDDGRAKGRSTRSKALLWSPQIPT